MHSSCNSLTAGSPPPLSLLRSMKPAICHQWTSHIHWSSATHQPVFLIPLSSFLVPQLTGSAHTHTCACTHAHTEYCSVFASPHAQSRQQLKKIKKDLFRFWFLKLGQVEDDCNPFTDKLHIISWNNEETRTSKYCETPLVVEELHLWGVVQSQALQLLGMVLPGITEPLFPSSAAQGGVQKQRCSLSFASLTHTDLFPSDTFPGSFSTSTCSPFSYPSIVSSCPVSVQSLQQRDLLVLVATSVQETATVITILISSHCEFSPPGM